MNPTLLKKLDPIARRIGFYTSYELDESEYIGRADGWHIKEILRQDSYESPPTFAGIPLAAAKEHPETGDVHHWSLRKVDPDHPRKQYHIHAWDLPSIQQAELYSHYEYRPDFARVGDETTGEMINRLRTHYRPEYGDDYVQGKADPTLRGLVE